MRKKQFHGSQVDDKKLNKYKVEDLVLVMVMHGRVVGSRVKWSVLKSMHFGPCSVK